MNPGNGLLIDCHAILVSVRSECVTDADRRGKSFIIAIQTATHKIKTLTALMALLSLRVGWKNDPEQGF